ncbi:hypothetical protein K445DRAFT_254960 [Daldinia sp. EC12]|nr:hypothetical protein K445DRAFT_254960 [Daldinia sp. EC12]
MPRRITPKGPDATQDPAKDPSPAFSKYQELVPELKLKIWRHAQLSPGVHFLSISCRTRLIDDDIAHVLHINPWADSSTDRSTWRIRKKVAKIDKYSWDVTERLLKGASTTRLWDFPRSRNPDAFVNPAQDLVCIRFRDRIINPGIHRFYNLERLAEIRHVAVEYKNQAISSRSHMGFQCLCRGNIHETSLICPKALEDFAPHFKDLETLYFMVQLTAKNIKSLPLAPKGKKRDHQGTVKEQVGQQIDTMPVSWRTRARNPQIVSMTFTRFRGKPVARTQWFWCLYLF